MSEKKIPEIDLENNSNNDGTIQDQNKNELINHGKNLLLNIKKECSTDNIDLIQKYVTELYELFSKNKNNELFYLLFDSLNQIVASYQENWDFEFISFIIEMQNSLLEKNLENMDFITTISDSILQSLEFLFKNDLLEKLEEHVIYLVNKSIDLPNNLVLRILSAEASIIAIKGFGEDWNYEKTKEFDIILKGLLPPQEINGILAGILIKGLAVEIDCYGDMHEFSSLKKTLKLMQELYAAKLDFDIEFLLNYSLGLINAIKWLGEAEEFEEMMIALNELTKLSEDYSSNLELKIALANGLRSALDQCGKMDDLENASYLAKILLQLADKDPLNKQLQSLAITGVLKAAIWAGAFWESGLINLMLENINKIFERFSNDNQIKITLARGLFNLTKEESLMNNEKLIRKIIEKLMNLYNKNPSIIELAHFYSQSLVNMLYTLGLSDSKSEDLFYFLTESKKLVDVFYEDEIISISYSKALVNVISAFGTYGHIEQMEELINVLKEYALSSLNIEITIRLGKAYIDAIKIFGDINELEKINSMLLEIREWLEDDQSNIDFQIILTKALVNTISAYGKNNFFNEMNLYMDELRKIALIFPTLAPIQIQLAKGLANTIRWYVQQSDLMRSISLLHELRSISSNFSDEIEIQEALARSIRRVVTLAYHQGKFDLVEELLDNLRKQLKQYPVNENIQVELVRALTLIFLEESNKEKGTFWDSLLMELKGLIIQYPNNAKVEEIHQTIIPLLKD